MADIVQAMGDALNRDMEALNQVAQNLANVNTPGYKSITATDPSAFQNKLVGGAVEANSITGGTEQNSTKLNFNAGSLKQTKRSLDIAVTGEAFLAVDGGSQILYTRNGSLKINSEGVLTNQIGMPLLGESGPLIVDSSAQIKVSRDGEVFQQDTIIGKLRLIDFADREQVSLVGNGLVATMENNIKPADSWVIHQGFIESSNVDTTQEMIRMMEISKHFESVQRALSIYDQALTSGITKLGQ